MELFIILNKVRDLMKQKGIKPPPETLKNKLDNPMIAIKDKGESTLKNNNIPESIKLYSNMEVKMSNEKRFVMETEF